MEERKLLVSATLLLRARLADSYTTVKGIFLGMSAVEYCTTYDVTAFW